STVDGLSPVQKLVPYKGFGNGRQSLNLDSWLEIPFHQESEDVPRHKQNGVWKRLSRQLQKRSVRTSPEGTWLTIRRFKPWSHSQRFGDCGTWKLREEYGCQRCRG